VPGLLIPNARAIRAAVRIPVIAVGRIEPEVADRCIGEGAFDFVAMGRKLLAEPHLPNKLSGAETGPPRPCVYCYTCNSQLYIGNAVRCAVNPDTGSERELAPVRTRRRLRTVVIGGGPAGLEAARRLASCGPHVTLLERAAELGGRLRLAAATYEPNAQLLAWLEREVRTLGIDVRNGVSADRDSLRPLRPDAVFVATGAARDPAAFPGRELALDIDDLDLREKDRVVIHRGASAEPLGRRVAVLGHDLIALQLAMHVAGLGHEVSVLDAAPKFGHGVALVRRWRVLHALRERGAALLPQADAISLAATDARTARLVRYRNTSGQIRSLEADHVVVARGGRPDRALADALVADGLSV
jgi:NADPH-dependent 2,4-dienoyl-CoA reductase/sulfur reductase-like enzyme